MAGGAFTSGRSYVGGEDYYGGVDAVAVALAGAANAASSASGTLSVVGESPLAGAANAVSSASATLTVTGGTPTPEPTTPALLEQSPWRVFVRDANLKRIAQLDTCHACKWVLRRNGVSSWTVTLAADDPAAAALLSSRQTGVQLMYEGETVSSGPMLRWIRTREFNRDELTFYGSSDDLWLARRVAHQSPATAAPDASGHYPAAYDTRTGLAEDVILAYIDANLGPSALPERRLTGLLMPPSFQRGTTVTGKARMQPLLELVRELALAGGDLGVRLYATPAGYALEVSEPRDLSAITIFGDPGRGNLSAYEYALAAPIANVAYVGGAGEEAAREFAVGSSPTSVTEWGRAERFIDERSASGATELAQAILTALDENGAIIDFQAQPVETIAGARFWLDWRLGDTVAFNIDGVVTHEVVQQVELEFQPAGERVICHVASSGMAADLHGSTSSPLAQFISAVVPRLIDLERR